MVKKIAVHSILLLCIFGLFSEDVTSKITVSSESVGVNEPFQLDVEISNAKNLKFRGIENPDPAISINQVSLSSRQVQVFQNGVTTASTATVMTFYVVISREGKYDIGPFLYDVKDKNYKTDTVTINVISLGNNAKSDSKNNDTKSISKDDTEKILTPDEKSAFYMIKAYSDKNEAYINEPIELTVKIFLALEQRTIKYGGLVLPSNSWIENMLNQKDSYQGIVEINNRRYQEYIADRKKVFISSEGVYNIPPVEYQFYGYKTNDFFAEPVEMVIKSNPISIKIKPFPQNAPEGFNGIVGNLKLSSNIDKTDCKTGDPVNLKIILEGTGNFQNLKDASYDIPDNFEIYSSKNEESSKDGRNIKIWDILAVPKKPGKSIIKVNDFIFFDPDKKTYTKLKGNSYTINVKTDNAQKEKKAVIIDNKNETKEIKPVSDLANIKTVMGRQSMFFNYNLWFIIILVSYASLFVFLAVYVSKRFLVFSNYMNRDMITKKNSFKNFSKKIGDLEESMRKNKVYDILNSIYVISENYFKSKFNIESVEFTNTGIKDKLATYLEKDEIKELKDIFKKIDMHRFGGIELNNEEAKLLLTQITGLVRRVENRIKS